MAIDILTDQPYPQQDILNFTKYAGVLANIVTSTQELPCTVGIFGDWGSGKTTLMRMVQSQVRTHCKTVWFNAWKYDQKPYVSGALLKTIFDEAMQSENINAEVIKDLVRQAASIVGSEAQGKPWSTFFFETFSLDPTYQYLIEEATYQLIKQYVGDNGRLVIFIDDVDRCSPENTLAILKMLNLHLANEFCLAVVGADKGMLEKAINQSYPDLNVNSKDHLEKLIQIPFRIPQADKTRLRQYLLQQTLPTGESFKELRPLAEMIVSGADQNMRRLKRLVNQLKLILEIAGITSAKAMTVAILTKLLVLQARFPVFYELVEQSPQAIYLLHQVFAAKDATAREGLLERLPVLGQYAENQPLVNFFRDSSQVTCQDRAQVEKLLELVAIAK